MDYKDTLLIGKTDFEMRGNLPKKEPAIQNKWQELNLYERIMKNNEGKPSFVLHDGPPYANGNIHVGHALNKILKDFVVRSKNMSGYSSPFVPGWDTHGLPIETALTKKGVNRKTMTVAEFRNKCYDYALEQVEVQRKQFEALGSIGDYKNPYITLQKEFEANQIDVFAQMALEGLIYKGLKPVYWSPSSESALAEAEIEYHEKTSASIYVKFHVNKEHDLLTKDDAFVIWTTTPWTMPANLGIALNPELEYGVYATEKGNLIFLKELAPQLKTALELDEFELVKSFYASDVEGLTTKHPLYDRDSLIIVSDHVTAESGTGCVHTAPGHGEDDFRVGMKYGLDILCPVNERGVMTAEAGLGLEGMFYEEANKVVGQLLEEAGALLKLDFIKHSYPHDWRTKKPIIFRATAQWFASIEKIREFLLSEIESVNWVNKWGEKRLYNMIRDRGDWCISRQRSWGVPIPIFYGEDGTEIIDEKIFNHISKLFREHGSSIWFEKTANELLPEGYTHPSAPNNQFTKETDIMDVWFDSGSSHTGVLKERGMGYPSDLYLEGSDQYRGWFNSSLIVGAACHKQAPYRQVLSHGFVLDGQGNKMSKSKGNVVDPLKILNQYGADILRLWVASVDYQNDVRISDEMMKQVADSYRKIRNTYKFLLGNLSDFSLDNLMDPNEMPLVDQYMINNLNNLIQETKDNYTNYEFPAIYNGVMNFIVKDLSAFYLDFTKDILYIEKADSTRRRQVQTVLFYTLDALNRLLTPILPHTCEEVYQSMNVEKELSVHLLQFPELVSINNTDTTTVEKFLEVRDDVLKALEMARSEKRIGKSQQAQVNIALKEEYQQALAPLSDQLAQLFIVSKVVVEEFNNGVELDTCYINVTKMDGVTCPRCWNVIEEDQMHHDVCDRCYAILND